MKQTPPTQHDLKTIAHSIGHGHAYIKHVEKRNEFVDRSLGLPLAITTRLDLTRHVERVLTDKTTRFLRSHRGKVYFYNFRSNTAVAYDPGHKDLGSCWRATAGMEEIRRLVLQDFKRKLMEPNLGVTPLRALVHAGGISALPMDDQTVSRSSFATPSIHEADETKPKPSRYLVPRHRSGWVSNQNL